MLYKNLPRNVGLKRLTLHKSATGPNVNYILLVECSHFLDNINQVISSATIENNFFNSPHLTGSQPATSAASEDMRLYRNLPHRRVLLTLSSWVRDHSTHPTEPRPHPGALPIPTVPSVPRTLGSGALVRHQEV